jgi:23S rRNA (pseudouridine1915-N3)-methyltransferase
MRIRVLWEGKTKDAHLRALEQDYAARIGRFIDFAVEERPAARSGKGGSNKKLSASDRNLIARLEGSTKVFLDPSGVEWTSPQLAEWLGKQGVCGVREVTFLIGEPDGFSQAVRDEADVLLALSRMTLTHDWARALLLEQIYRSFAILRGFPYAR